MAIGSRYNAGADNYLSMANQADQAAINEAKGMVSLFESGYNTMSKMKDRQRLDEARQAFETAWSSGNPEDVQRVIARFPEYGAQLQKALGVRDEQNRQQMGSLAIQLSGMLESGNIEGAQALLRNNPALFDKQGMFSAESVADAIGRAATGTDADSAKRLAMWKDWAQKLSLSILKPNEIMNYGLSQQQMAQQLEMQKNALEQQLQVANDRLGLGYAQLASMQEHRERMLQLKEGSLLNLGGEGMMTDSQGNPMSAHDYNRKLLQFGTDPRTGKRATSAQLSNAQKWMKGAGEFTSAMQNIDHQQRKVHSLLNMDLDAGTGWAQGQMSPSFMTSEAQAVRNGLATIMSGEFMNNIQQMKGMGSLSNAEGQRVIDLVAALDPTQSAKEIKRQLMAIDGQLNRLRAANLQDAADMGYGMGAVRAYEGAGNVGGGGDSGGKFREGDTATNKATGEKMVFSNGEWVKL